MTRDGQGIDPEEVPSPPTSTRWSEPDADDEAELLPPFVPGRRESPGESVTETTEALEETAEPEPAVDPEIEPGAGAYPSGEPVDGDDAAQIADRLEALSRRLRMEGVSGVEAEMASSDRMTALLAGLIAGYIAGREA